MKQGSELCINRRDILRHAAGGAAAAAVGAAALAGPARAAERANATKAVTKGRIKQSIVEWCFAEHWDIERMSQIAKQLGCVSVELVDPKHWPTLKKYGLICAIATIDMSPDLPFLKGMNNPKHWDRVLAETRKSIDACAEYGFPNVISFTGYSDGISDEEGVANCVAGYKKIIGYAEKKKVNLCLELLNTREDTHPMKGHPGYQGDHVDYCMEILNKVGSPRLKMLFDIYHVQIMDGDVIRRIRQLGDAIGHVHTAGNPGRGELDDKQELNYPPIMEALVEIGYKGYVGQEFLATRDPLEGLQQAVKLCDV